MSIGPHKFEFEVIQGWGQLPEGWSYFEVAGVGVDSRDRVYVFTRGDHPIIVFDKEGKFLNAWGEGVFTSPHGVFIDRDDNIYLSDDGDHTVRVFDPDGNLKQTIGEAGVAADTGYLHNVRPVLFGGKPFNRVTNVAKGRNGDLYIADGYGNARVHRFSADGKHITSWGQPGGRPGEFNLPHAIGVDSSGRVYVADRENSRVQIFTENGSFIREWAWVNRPLDIFIDDQDFIHISESGWVKPTNTPLHYHNKHAPVCGHDPISRVTVCDPDGKVVAVVGGNQPVLPGNFVAPHGIYCDSKGSLYVGQVIQRSGSAKYFAPLPLHAFQKFKRAG
jgi:DNA-binding beta-propeller fold protein YncE